MPHKPIDVYLGLDFMPSEFENQIQKTAVNETEKREIMEIIKKAGEEFPCLSCTSKDECNNFNWFKKWFTDEPPE